MAEATAAPETPEDPNARHRETVGYVAAGLLALSGFGADTTYLWPDGSHGPLLAPEFSIARIAILLLIAVLVVALVRQPNRPDVRVAKAGSLAAAMVAIVVGLNAFLTALNPPDVPQDFAPLVPDSMPGPAAWMLLAAGLLLTYLRFRRDLWPESLWEQEILAAAGRRRRM